MAGRTARLDVGVWYNSDTGHIHISAKDHFISTVNNEAGSKRCHANLYWKLARALRDSGMPHPPIPRT
jgi:hypothetical protein